MENFEILSNGKKINVTKKDNNYTAYIPSKRNPDRYEYVTRDKLGWRHSSAYSNDSSKFLNIWITDDGRVMHNDNILKEVQDVGEFVPNMETSDVILATAQELYDIVGKIYEHELLPIPATDILKLRKEKLESTMQLIGVSFEEERLRIDSDTGYKVLGRIGKELEDYRNLAFVQRDRTSKDGYSLNLQDDTSREKMSYKLSETKTQLEKDKQFMEVQNDFLSRARYIVPDFGLDMKSRVTEKEWKDYTDILSQTMRLYLELNSDIIPEDIKRNLGIRDLCNLQDEEMADRISQLIDSRKFDRACNIEDRFVISEAERFSKRVDSLGLEDEMVRNTSVGVALEGIKREALSTRDKKNKYNERYAKMENIFEGKKAQIDTKAIEESGVDYNE